MGEKYTDHIIVSPHMDDAFLINGGYILILRKIGVPVHIIDCFTESGYAPNASGEDPSEARRAEDNLCVEITGCILHDLCMQDAPVRNKEMYGKPNICIDSIGLEYFMSPGINHERKTIEELKSRLEKKIKEIGTDSIVLFPKGIGNHIDHMIANEACMELVKERVIKEYGVTEDMPYAAIPHLRFAPLKDKPFRESLREIDWKDKEDIILNYKSQPVSKWVRPMEAYALETGKNNYTGKGKYAERIWVPG